MRDWLVHQLVANFWSLPLAAILLSLGVSSAGIRLDRTGLADWVIRHDLDPVPSAAAAQDFTIAVVGMDAAFLALYISIVLIVLTLAAGNLGMRLVDRWLGKNHVRLSLAGLCFCLVHSLIVLMAIDPEGPANAVPLGSIWLMLALQIVNIGMLCVSAHDLGRTMFIDRSIAHLGQEAGRGSIAVRGALPHQGELPFAVHAPREGYIQGLDLPRLAAQVERCGYVQLCTAPGQHVLEGEVLARLEREPEDEKAIARLIPIGDFRSDAESSVFQIRLLVEVAARALSPGINDFYTADAAADRLAHVLASQAQLWVDEGMVPVMADNPRVELNGQDFHGLFTGPLKSFRQSAADYPEVTIRMLENYGRVARLADNPGLRQFLHCHARDLCEHALLRTRYARDSEEIRAAFARFPAAGKD